jgi:hypothetical protein
MTPAPTTTASARPGSWSVMRPLLRSEVPPRPVRTDYATVPLHIRVGMHGRLNKRGG